MGDGRSTTSDGRPQCGLLRSFREEVGQRKHWARKKDRKGRFDIEDGSGLLPSKALDSNEKDEDDVDDEHEVVEEFEGREVTRGERDRWLAIFYRLRHDGQIHATSLVQAMQLCGHDRVEEADTLKVLKQVTQYTNLSEDEFMHFVCLFEVFMEQSWREHFDKVAVGGLIKAVELPAFFESLNLRFRRCALAEVGAEVEKDFTLGGVGLLSFEACRRAVEICRLREGFQKHELDQFGKAFQVFDRDMSGDIAPDELWGALQWLGLRISQEEMQRLFFEQSAGSTSIGLGEREFLRLLRRVYELEVDGVHRMFGRTGAATDGYVTGEALEDLLQGLGYHVPPEAILEAMQDMGTGGRHVGAILADPNGVLNGLMCLRGMRFKVGVDEVCELLTILRSREGFTRTEWQELKDIFLRFCPDGEHELPVQGVGRALRWVGHPCSLDSLRSIMADIDTAGSFAMSLDLALFLKLVRKCRDGERECAVQTFKRFDTQASGMLPWPNVLQALTWLGCVDRQGRPPISVCKERHQVDLHKFVKIVQRFRMETLEETRDNSGFTDADVYRFEILFKKFDTDGSGDIGRKELCKLIEHFFPTYAHSPDWRPHLVQLLHDADKDGNGALDFSEFLALMRAITDQEEEGRIKLELSTIDELCFAPHEVRDLRVLFLKADEDGSGRMAPSKVRGMLASCWPLNERAFHQVDSMVAQAMEDAEYKGSRMPFLTTATLDGGNDGKVDFPGFLRVMRRFVDSGLMETGRVRHS